MALMALKNFNQMSNPNADVDAVARVTTIALPELSFRRGTKWHQFTKVYSERSGEPDLVDRVLALHAGRRGFDSHRGHMSERFFRSNRPGYPHPVSSELENSGIRVAVGDCSVTERRRWRPPYQTGKTVHVHAKHYKHNEDGRTAPGVCGNGSVPLSHSGNVVTRIGIHTHTHKVYSDTKLTYASLKK